jgi:hypothetical protein
MTLGAVFAPRPWTPAPGLVRKSQERAAPGSGVLSARRRQGLPPPAALSLHTQRLRRTGNVAGLCPATPLGPRAPDPICWATWHAICHEVRPLPTVSTACRRGRAAVQYVTCHVLHGNNADALPNVARHCRRGLASTQHFLIPAPLNPETSVQAHLPLRRREGERALGHGAGQVEGEEPSSGRRGSDQRGPARRGDRGDGGRCPPSPCSSPASIRR